VVTGGARAAQSERDSTHAPEIVARRQARYRARASTRACETVFFTAGSSLWWSKFSPFKGRISPFKAWGAISLFKARISPLSAAVLTSRARCTIYPMFSRARIGVDAMPRCRSVARRVPAAARPMSGGGRRFAYVSLSLSLSLSLCVCVCVCVVYAGSALTAKQHKPNPQHLFTQHVVKTTIQIFGS
jgi:hypothetical protein